MFNNYCRLFKGNVYKLNGDMDHSVRKEMFNGFNTAKSGILISTDVAARGLDFQGIHWVVHYDVNREIKEYVNRIGRTARLNTEVLKTL
jgi:superfamily II DNA/RNA helicase